MRYSEIVEIVQNAVFRDDGMVFYLGATGASAEDMRHVVTESNILGYWKIPKFCRA